MTIIRSDKALFFGMAEDETLPVLPKGFTFIKNPNDWLFATDGRKRYYVSKLALFQQIKARPNRKVKSRRRSRMWVYKNRGIFKGLNYQHVFLDNRKTIPLKGIIATGGKKDTLHILESGNRVLKTQLVKHSSESWPKATSVSQEEIDALE